MLDLSGELIRDYRRGVIGGTATDIDLYLCAANEIMVVHSLCVVNLETAADTLTAFVGVDKGGLLYWHDSKVGFGANVCLSIVMPLTVREGENLRVNLIASAADTPYGIAFQGIAYKIRDGKIK